MSSGASFDPSRVPGKGAPQQQQQQQPQYGTGLGTGVSGVSGGRHTHSHTHSHTGSGSGGAGEYPSDTQYGFGGSSSGKSHLQSHDDSESYVPPPPAAPHRRVREERTDGSRGCWPCSLLTSKSSSSSSSSSSSIQGRNYCRDCNLTTGQKNLITLVVFTILTATFALLGGFEVIRMPTYAVGLIGAAPVIAVLGALLWAMYDPQRLHPSQLMPVRYVLQG